MPNLTIQKGSEINQTEQKTIKIQVRNTQFWILGEQKTNKLWDVWMIDPKSGFKEIIKTNKTTKSFAMFSNIILKEPFPYEGKQATKEKKVKKFIKTITKKIKTNGQPSKSSKIQGNSKRGIKNEANKRKTI